ncbi:DUF1127 domain-containing protein [Primorskyibacter sp. S187A]|uniref:DUF1127 domain-containing protein n=1 Tax=Primorskyibacter sp. S187A TaxID=3415130 RepID=UPI003C798FAA
MTLSNVQFAYPAPGWRARLDLFVLTLGLGMNPQSLTRGRINEIAQLEGLSDGELAARGLRRADIAAHVFQDMFSHR